MEKSKPIKRSMELAPLSRDHHEGLLFVWKIKQGLANNTAPETLYRFTRWFWDVHLSSHFKSEEEVLVKYLPAEHPLVQQMIAEHTQIRDLLFSLGQVPDLATLKQFADKLNDHIRFEERHLFVYAERMLTPGQLNEIYQQLQKPLSCSTGPHTKEWDDEFWVKKK